MRIWRITSAITYAKKPKEITDQEKLEDYCAEECEMGQHFCNILNQCNKINNFEESELRKIMTKYQEIVLCKECEYKASHPVTDLSYCRPGMGMDGTLKRN